MIGVNNLQRQKKDLSEHPKFSDTLVNNVHLGKRVPAPEFPVTAELIRQVELNR